MKNYLTKIIATLLLSLFTFTGYSQTEDKADKLQIGKYDPITKVLNWGDAMSIDLVFTFNGKNVSIDDKAKTRLYCYEQIEEKSGVNNEGDKYTKYTWVALDEKERKCHFSMIYYKDRKLSVYVIVYEDIVFRYYIENSKLSNFIL